MKKNFSISELEEIGFNFDNKGKITGINGNIYARHILNHFNIAYSVNGSFYLYQDGVYRKLKSIELSKKLRKFLHKYVENYWSEFVEGIYISALKREAILVKDFDKNKNILNLTNGLLDLKTYELMPHMPEFKSTIRLPICYDRTMDCPRFKKFLKEVFQGDKRLIKVAQELLGYSLTSYTKAQKAFLLIGSGSNGKSTFINVIRDLCGLKNVSSVPINELENSFKRNDLLGKNVNLVSENEFSSLNTQYFKAIVSGDLISAEIKHGPTYSFSPFCKIIMAMNSLPRTKDLSDGFKRRLLIIPFNSSFKKSDVDKALPKKFRKERDGIFNFALEGLKRLTDNDFEFTESKKINKTLEDYFGNVDHLYRFVQEEIIADSHNKITYTSLYDAYKQWLYQEGGELKMNRIEFSNSIKSRLHSNGIPFTLGKSGERYIKGINYKDNDYIEL